QASTTTTLTSDTNPSVFGQSVTFTASVVAAPGSGTPTGSVQFVIDGSNFGSPVALVNGSASISDAALNVNGSPHSITAVYSGAPNFITSTTTSAVSQVVNQASTTTTVSSIANPSVFGQSVTFTASVVANAPGSGTPTGSVQFVIDGSNFGSPVALVNGSATSNSDTALNVNGSPHTITAVYTNSDGNFTGSPGTLSGGQTVNADSTSTAVS